MSTVSMLDHAKALTEMIQEEARRGYISKEYLEKMKKTIIDDRAANYPSSTTLHNLLEMINSIL